MFITQTQGRSQSNMSNTYYGKYEGIVEDNQDPLNIMRLRLRVPAVLGDKVSNWAFPCVPYGGRKNVGDFNPPETGTKVWVEFKGGNPVYPIWTGFFWSQPGGESEVPDGVDDKHRLIQTSSGHKIEIVGETGQELIRVTTQGGHKIELLDIDGSEKIRFEDNNGNYIMLDTVNNKLIQEMAEILLGEGATERAVLGDLFMSLYNSHTHPGDSGGTTGAPNQQMSGSQLSSTVKVKG